MPLTSCLNIHLWTAKKAGAEYAKAKEEKLKLAVEEMQLEDYTDLNSEIIAKVLF